MTRKKPKKSEMLEVRVSYETKQELHKRARQENRSVSEIVRAQIHAYLKAPGKVSLKQHLMHWFERPRALILAGISALLLSLSYSTGASAGNIALKINGEFTQVLEQEPLSIRTRTFVTEIHIDKHGTGMEFPAVADNLKISILTSPVTLEPSQKEGILIKMIVIDTSDGTDRLIAAPSLKSAYGEEASFEFGSEDQNFYSVGILPTILKD